MTKSELKLKSKLNLLVRFFKQMLSCDLKDTTCFRSSDLQPEGISLTDDTVKPYLVHSCDSVTRLAGVPEGKDRDTHMSLGTML